MPAAIPVEKRRDVPVLTRLTRTERDHLRSESARRRTTVAAEIRTALKDAGLLPDTPR